MNGGTTKILLLDTNDQMGGVVRVHLSLLRSLDRASCDVHLACLGRGKVFPFFKAVPEVTMWPVETGTKSKAVGTGLPAKLANAAGLVPFFVSAVRLAARCRRAGIRLIHTSDKKRAVILTTLLHRWTGIPFLYHVHNHYVDYPANRRALALAGAIVANSGEMRADFIRHLGSTMERIRVIHNGIDPDEYTPAPSMLRAELGAAPDDMLVGVASRLAPDKGQETLLRAAALTRAAVPQTRIVLIGDDAVFSDNAAYVPMLKRLAGELGIADRVHFLGYRRDMVNLYNGLDIVANTAWYEAFGMVVIEAMACGKPVVGTAAGGIPEIIADGRDGYLVPPRDEKALAEAFIRLAGDASLRARVGAVARQTVLDRFTIRTQSRAIERVYAELAASKAAS